MDLIIDGRYQLLKRLDHDDSSALYVASDLKTGQVACLRMWAAGPRASDYVVQTPPGEQPQLKPSDDPRIVSPYDWGVDREVIYLARDYIPGRSLTDLVEREGPLSVSVATGLATQIADAVATAHADGLAHGSLRPSQIVVGDDGHVHLLGFEEAAVQPEPPRRESRPIRGFAPPSARGSAPSVVAEPVEVPEHAAAERQRQQDTYALGALYHFMLTGDDRLTKPAFLQNRAHVATLTPLAPSAERHTVPRIVDDAVAYATTKDGHGRLPSAADVAQRFRVVEARVGAARRHGAHRPAGDDAALSTGRLGQAIRYIVRSFADVQGHLAIALLIALAAGLFALTVDRSSSAIRAPASTVAATSQPTPTSAVLVAPAPSVAPTAQPTAAPTAVPTAVPTEAPTIAPTATVESRPARAPTAARERVSQSSAARPSAPTTTRRVVVPTPTAEARVEAPAPRAAPTKEATATPRIVAPPTPTPTRRPAPTVAIVLTPPPNLATPAPGLSRAALSQP